MRPCLGPPPAACLGAPAWPSRTHLPAPVAAFAGVCLCRWVLTLLVALPLSLGSQPVQLRGIQHSGIPDQTRAPCYRYNNNGFCLSSYLSPVTLDN